MTAESMSEAAGETEPWRAAAAETAHPRDVAEVAAAVRRAGAEGRAIAVRAGGHGHWTPEPGALTIDLRALASVEVEGARVRIGGGALWHEVAEQLAPHGLAISSGDTATVGVGGLTLGGGVGWMVRAWGLAADQLRGAQVVVADGRIVEASATENPELFWALRGGGGNLGVVTRFDFEAHSLPGIAFADLKAADDHGAFLRAMRDVLRDAPRELTTTFMDVPPMDPSAPPGAGLTAVWAGPEPERLAGVLAPVHALPGVAGEVTTPSYREILMEMPANDGPAEEQGPPGFLGGNGLFAELDDDLIDRLVAFRRDHPASVTFVRSLGGAFGDVPQAETPFPGRGASWFVMAGAFDHPGMDEESRTAALRDWAAIGARRLSGYGNFTDAASGEDMRRMYEPEAFARLARIKAEWDPRNLFRTNHNVPPTA